MPGYNLLVAQKHLGAQSPLIWFDVEKGAIRRFAESIGDTNPLYWDEAAARNSRHGAIIAPPTFPTTFRDGLRPEVPDLIGTRLHGEQGFTYKRPLRVGDRVGCQTTFVDVKEKQSSSGYLTLLRFETTAHDEAGEVVFTADQTSVVISNR